MSKSSKSSSHNLKLWIIYINIALYATCFQIQRPLEPFLVDKLVKQSSDVNSANEYARLQAFFSLLQTIGSLASGRLLDIFGAKGGFLISFGASALCYALLTQSTTISILYASKIPTIFQAGFLCAQAAVSQTANDGTERVQALGFLTMSYTVGSVIGPAVGGFLGASGDYYFGAKIAVAGSVLSMFLTLLMPDGEVNKVEKTDKVTSAGEANTAKLPSYLEVIRVVWLLLATKVISSVANSMAASAFPLVLKNTYSLNESGVGYSMSVMSAFNGIVNGFLLEPAVRAIGGDLTRLISLCLTGMTIFTFIQATLVLPSVAHSPLFSAIPGDGLYQFLLSSFLLSVIQYVLATTITGESTGRVSQSAKGTLLGLEHALFAAARIASPQLGVTILTTQGVSSVCYACAGIYLAVTLLYRTVEKDSSASKKPQLAKTIDSEVERKEK
jgi:OCT family organic cation transporter-like MFS transporter 18